MTEPLAPFATVDLSRAVWSRGEWPARWIRQPGGMAAPGMWAFRLRVALARSLACPIHVSADERCELFVDGVRVGRGPEAGDPAHWRFHTWALDLAPGEHVLVAIVTALGEQASFAQMSAEPGFLLAADAGIDPDLLNTGRAAWECRPLPGVSWLDPGPAWGTGARPCLDGAAWIHGVEGGAGEGFVPAEAGEIAFDPAATSEWPRSLGPKARFRYPGHRLLPARLPAMLERPWRGARVRHAAPLAGESIETPVAASAHDAGAAAAWQGLLDGGDPVTVPPRSRWRVVVDLGDYACVRTALATAGGSGARIELVWCEALFAARHGDAKGHRDAIDGRWLRGCGPRLLPGGGDESWAIPGWEAGRYVGIVVETGAASLRIAALGFTETRYPLEIAATWRGDAAWDDLLARCRRTLECCAHDTWVDCPYYERLQYVGDTRLDALMGYCLGRDDRLATGALRQFAWSRLDDGLIQSRFPNRQPQSIPPFSLWWAAMVHDLALWRGERALVAELMPQAREVCDRFWASRDAAGLVVGPPGWNFVDWMPPWAPAGIAAGADVGQAGAILTFHLAYTLALLAEVEAWLDEPELAARHRRRAAALVAACEGLWDAGRGLYADEPSRRSWSEHAQILALLSGCLAPERAAAVRRGLAEAADLVRTTLYFRHYLLEALHAAGDGAAVARQLEPWGRLGAHGFRTTFEMPEPSRSDCHAWAAHPLYHWFATVLGIRPAAMGFARVAIAPLLPGLAAAEGVMAHHAGDLRVALARRGAGLVGEVVLPPGLSGELRWAGAIRALAPGANAIDLGG